MSIWNGKTKEQEAFDEGVRDGISETKSVGGIAVNMFKQFGNSLAYSQKEKESYRKGLERGHEIANSEEGW